jgi:hypothetical protein
MVRFWYRLGNTPGGLAVWRVRCIVRWRVVYRGREALARWVWCARGIVRNLAGLATAGRCGAVAGWLRAHHWQSVRWYWRYATGTL